MKKMISALTGVTMWVTDDQVKAHLAAGDTFAAPPPVRQEAADAGSKMSDQEKPASKSATKKPAAKKTARKPAKKTTKKPAAKRPVQKKPVPKAVETDPVEEGEGEW